jgi:hypothetical protein
MEHDRVAKLPTVGHLRAEALCTLPSGGDRLLGAPPLRRPSLVPTTFVG